MLDTLTIGVIVACVIFMIGGLIFAHYGNKVSLKMQEEEMKKEKERQEAIRKQKNR